MTGRRRRVLRVVRGRFTDGIPAHAIENWDPQPARRWDPPCWCGADAVATRAFPDAKHPQATREGYCARHWAAWCAAVGAGA